MDFNAQDLDNVLQMNVSVGNRSVLKELNKNDGGSKLSPLAVRPSPRHSIEQQKLLIAALRSPSQPTDSCDPQRSLDVEQTPALKFTGLPEFDETQIPELAPLIADIDAQLKPDVRSPVLNSMVIKQEQDYNSDSDVYVECLSLNSAKFFSADQSELEAYSSALNVLDHHLSNATTATTLDNTLSEATASPHNDSCEPMDIDDINETMELLKDVLAPEDCKLLQQTCLGGALNLSNANEKTELKEEQIKTLENDEKEKQVNEQLEKPTLQSNPAAPISPIIEQHEMFMDLPTQEQSMQQTLTAAAISPPQQLAAVPLHPTTATVKEEPQQDSPKPPSSPPIPTHRAITAKELAELRSMLAYEEPLPTTPNEEQQEEQPVDTEQGIPIASVEPIQSKQKHFPSLELSPDYLQIQTTSTDTDVSLDQRRTFNMNDTQASSRRTITLGSLGTAPISPTFPMKSSAVSPSQFPRSPNAPPENLEMCYLEEAVIEPTAEHKVFLAGVVAKSPLPIQVTITESSPEQHREEVKEETHLNGTFDSGTSPQTTSIDTDSATRRATSGVSLDESSEQQRRTFNMNDTQASSRRTITLETPLNGTFDSGTSPQTTSIDTDSATRRATFGVSLEGASEEAQTSSRRTITLETSPEENIKSDELEPMDVDVSMRAETTLLAENETVEPPSSPSQPEECQQDTESSPILAQQQQHIEQLNHSKPLRPSPPLPDQLKRPSIHQDAPQPTCPNATVVLEEQTLSVKELLSIDNEKDVYVDHFGAMSPITEDILKPPQYTSSTFNSMARNKTIGAANPVAATAAVAGLEQFDNSEFQDGASNNNIILSSSDLDYLFTKGSNDAPIDRSSLLLKFDPLLGVPVPVNHSTQQGQTLLSILSCNNNNNNLTRALSPTLEEHETSVSNQSQEINKKNAKMSVDVIDNDCNKTFDNSNLNSEEKTHKYHNMDGLEKKIKNEVTRSEDIENKLKEAEQREEALVKRITEKDKNNAKLNGVIEAYEKAIAELIHDKEQLVQNHERQMAEVQADRDSNYTHLMSLETTFSDLHIKYEKSKEMTSHLKQIEDNLLDEKKKINDKLRQQEQRYEQMKSHAMQQMEIANRKLCTLTREHTDEVKKLKALLKKEEVSRISTAEQLQQKSRENADLLKICEELIYDQGQGGSS